MMFYFWYSFQITITAHAHEFNISVFEDVHVKNCIFYHMVNVNKLLIIDFRCIHINWKLELKN